MLTIFTTAKPFRGRFTVIQENAIASWTKIKPRCQIILFGNEPGSAKIAKTFKLLHITDVKRNEYGTPILSDMFKKARNISKNELICYVNCDIILPSNLTTVLKGIKLKKFLITGRKWNVSVTGRIDFNDNWEQKIQSKAKRKRELTQVGALDYFIFPKGINFRMPSFAIGRWVWDNWLIFKAKYLKIPVIDATDVILAIHQKHDYSHAGNYKTVRFGMESKINLALASDKKRPFNLVNADFILSSNGLVKPNFSVFRLWRNFQIDPIINPQRSLITWPLVLAIEFVIKVFRKFQQ